MDYSAVLVSWIHITCAAILVGGTFFFRVVLLKWAARDGGLSEPLRDRLANRWIHTAGGLLFVLLATGLYSFTLRNESWKAGAYDNTASPHMIFGIKFLIVVLIGVFVIMAAKMKPKRPKLMLANAILGIVVIGMSVWLVKSYRVPSPAELEAYRGVTAVREALPSGGQSQD